MAEPEKMAALLTDITSNLAAYIEDQAQTIARMKIEAVERAFEHRLRTLNEGHEIREMRSSGLIAELRRRVSALEKQQEKARLREVRVRGVAEELESQDLPEAATSIRNALNFVGHMRVAR